jgi:hypothetical protein
MKTKGYPMEHRNFEQGVNMVPKTWRDVSPRALANVNFMARARHVQVAQMPPGPCEKRCTFAS